MPYLQTRKRQKGTIFLSPNQFDLSDHASVWKSDKKQLVAYFEENNLINESQHGFRKGRSCLTQLLKHYDEILTDMEEGTQVNVLYVDFEKCFDKIDFKILLNKLKLKGVGGNVSTHPFQFQFV